MNLHCKIIYMVTSLASFSKSVYKTTKMVIDLTFAFKPQGLGLEAFKIKKCYITE